MKKKKGFQKHLSISLIHKIENQHSFIVRQKDRRETNFLQIYRRANFSFRKEEMQIGSIHRRSNFSLQISKKIKVKEGHSHQHCEKTSLRYREKVYFMVPRKLYSSSWKSVFPTAGENLRAERKYDFQYGGNSPSKRSSLSH